MGIGNILGSLGRSAAKQGRKAAGNVGRKGFQKARKIFGKKKKDKVSTQKSDGVTAALVVPQNSIVPIKRKSSELTEVSSSSLVTTKSSEGFGSSFTSAHAYLDSIVSSTTSISVLTEQQFKRRKKYFQKVRKEQAKLKSREEEARKENSRNKLVGLAGNIGNKVTGLTGFNPIDFIQNILLGGLALRFIGYVQEVGLKKAFALATRDYQTWRRMIDVIKGLLRTLFNLGRVTFKAAWRGALSGTRLLLKGILRVGNLLVEYIPKIGRAALRFARKVYKFAQNLLRGGKGVRDTARGVKGAADTARGVKGASDTARGVKGAADTARGGKGVTTTIRGIQGGATATRGATSGLRTFGGALRATRLPIIGPLLTGIISYFNGESTGETVTKVASTAIGGWIGLALGGLIAGSTGGIGAIAVPILGILGEIIGEYIGDIIWTGVSGGGFEGIQKQISTDFSNAFNFGKDFVTNGLSNLMEYIPKWDLRNNRVGKFLINSVDNLFGSDLAGYTGYEIPSLWWLLNPSPMAMIERSKAIWNAFFGGNESVTKDEQQKPQVTPESTKIDGYLKDQEEDTGRKTSSPQSSSPTGGKNTLIGSENASGLKEGAELLVRAGLSPTASAYLAGNIQQESSWNGQRDWGEVQGDGSDRNGGLISWMDDAEINHTRLTRIEEYLGKPIKEASDGEQIGAILWEMKTYYPSVYRRMMDSNSSVEAIKQALKDYIGWGDEGKRWDYSQQALDHLKNNPVRMSPTGGDTSGLKPQTELPPLPPTGTLETGAQAYGASRGGGRRHAGVDFDAGPNDSFYTRVGGEVVYIGSDPGGYGNYVDIYNPELDVTERIAEGDTTHVSVGDVISPGTKVQTGTNDTGVFHYEIRSGRNQTFGFAGTVNPLEFLKSLPQNPEDLKPAHESGDGTPKPLTAESINNATTALGGDPNKPLDIPQISSPRRRKITQRQYTLPTSEIPKEGAPQSEWDDYFRKIDGLKPMSLSPRQKKRRIEPLFAQADYELTGRDSIVMMQPQLEKSAGVPAATEGHTQPQSITSPENSFVRAASLGHYRNATTALLDKFT